MDREYNGFGRWGRDEERKLRRDEESGDIEAGVGEGGSGEQDPERGDGSGGGGRGERGSGSSERERDGRPRFEMT